MDTTPLRKRELACESHHEYGHFYRGWTTESSEFSAIQDHAALVDSRAMYVRKSLGVGSLFNPRVLLAHKKIDPPIIPGLSGPESSAVGFPEQS